MERLETYLAIKYPITVIECPEGGYFAEIELLRGCMTQGDSGEEILWKIEDARRLWIETALKNGDEIPIPPVEKECSGRVLLRMSKTLHRSLIKRAAREGVSLNHLIVSLLSSNNIR